ncbi:MAG: 4-alpha-glucanotransferase [Bilifractor sp.]
MRASGILMPVFSLPGRYGIGCFSEEAYRFADFLKKAGQKYWQILPLGPTGYGDSPYQSFSTFAGNPYFISLDELCRQGLIKKDDLPELPEGAREDRIDYGWLYNTRHKILYKAFQTWREQKHPDFDTFLDQNSYWIDDYALFMAEKDYHGGKSFSEWDDDIRFRKPEAIETARGSLSDQILYYEFVQYEFDREWSRLKKYVNDNGIQIIGDIPIYVSPDSADFWAHPELFQTDAQNRPSSVAGCPPDGFSADGQLWGNPLYDWEYHRKTGYSWWMRRIRKCAQLYDVIRIDHFRGFDEYYSIPAGSTTAIHGHWCKGPNTDLFDAIRKNVGDIQIIAEDLGYITDTVRKMVRDTGYPNMKVIEFAFDSRDSSDRTAYFPYNYYRNCVAYTGTHDNETLLGWLGDIRPEEKKELMEYLGTDTKDDQELVAKTIRLLESSVADLCVVPVQDWLGLGNEARINHPSTTGANWVWRLRDGQIDDQLADRMCRISRTYGRI